MPMLRLVVIVAAAVSLFLAAPAVANEAYYNYIPGACQKSFRCGDSVDRRALPVLPRQRHVRRRGLHVLLLRVPRHGDRLRGCECEGGRATLRLGGDNYTVLDINYGNHTVTVADADVLVDDCPRVTHNVTVPPETWINLSDTANDNLVFFYDCVFTDGGISPSPEVLPPINCSSFPNSSGTKSFVVLQPNSKLQGEWPQACKEPVVVPMLKRLLSPDEDYLSRLNSDGYGQVLKQARVPADEGPQRGVLLLLREVQGRVQLQRGRRVHWLPLLRIVNKEQHKTRRGGRRKKYCLVRLGRRMIIGWLQTWHCLSCSINSNCTGSQSVWKHI